MPQIAKRTLPAAFSDKKGSLKKGKANSVPIQIHDDEEYGSALNKLVNGLQTGGQVQTKPKFEVKEETKPKVEVKEETKPKVENDAKVQTAT
jgi:hypothetical protein